MTDNCPAVRAGLLSFDQQEMTVTPKLKGFLLLCAAGAFITIGKAILPSEPTDYHPDIYVSQAVRDDCAKSAVRYQQIMNKDAAYRTCVQMQLIQDQEVRSVQNHNRR